MFNGKTRLPAIAIAVNLACIACKPHNPLWPAEPVAAHASTRTTTGSDAPADGNLAALPDWERYSVEEPERREEIVHRIAWAGAKRRYEKRDTVDGVRHATSIGCTVTRDVRGKIQSAFQRHAAIDAKNVKIDVLEGTVTLSGEVHSWHEKDDAETAAWSAPGVKHVKNQSVGDYLVTKATNGC